MTEWGGGEKMGTSRLQPVTGWMDEWAAAKPQFLKITFHVSVLCSRIA